MWNSNKLESINLDRFECNDDGFHTFFEDPYPGFRPKEGLFFPKNNSIERNFSSWLGINIDWNNGLVIKDLYDSVKKMLNGTERNGVKSLGLMDVFKMKINPDYYTQNLKQHSGFAAEIISTLKDNLIAKNNNSEIRTYRADDFPEFFKKNDEFVDKFRVDKDMNIIEKIQTKFVGKDGDECLKKLMSKKYDKYFEPGRVDKMEISQENYDDIRNNQLIEKKMDKLQKQFDKMNEQGKVDVAEQIENKINRLKQIDEKLLRSSCSQSEALYATQHPKLYSAKLFLKNAFDDCHTEGLAQTKIACGLTAITSTVDNVSQFIDGNIDVQQMLENITKDTATSGALAYGTGFISTSVSNFMQHSSRDLIRTIGGSCLPGLTVSFVVDSYDSISDFMQGSIELDELIYELGDSAAAIGGGFAGSMIGGALTGAAFGSVGGPLGTVIGFGGGMIGGLMGTVISTEMYATAVEAGLQNLGAIEEKIVGYATDTIEGAKQFIGDNVDGIKNAFNDYFASNSINIKL